MERSVSHPLLAQLATVAVLLAGLAAPAAATTPPAPSQPSAGCDASIGGRCYVNGAFTLSSFSSGAHHYKVCRSTDTLGWGGCDVTMTTSTGSSFTVSGFDLPADGYRRAYRFSACDGANNCTPWTANSPTYVYMDQSGPTAAGPTAVSCAYATTGPTECWVLGTFTAGVTPASDAGSGVAGYQVCRSLDSTGGNGGCQVTMSTNAGTSFTVGGADLPSDGYRRAYYFRAKDRVGNWGSWNTPRYVRVDRYPPLVSATNASDSWSTSRAATVSAADSKISTAANSGLAWVRYRWNAPLDAACTAGTATASGATLTAPEGDNTLYLCARDRTGQTKQWSGRYRVDSGAPTAPGPTTVGCSYTTTSPNECWVRNTFTASVTPATDGGSGVVGYRVCRSDDSTGGNGGCQATLTYDAGTSWTISGADLPSDGFRRAYYFKAKDALGNWGPWNTPRYVRLDRHPPTVSASDASDVWLASRTATVAADDAVSGAGANAGLDAVRYRWNAPLDSACTAGTPTAPGTVLTAPGGDNTLYLCARDLTGRLKQWNGHYPVDNVPPSQNLLAVVAQSWSVDDQSSYPITLQATDSQSGVREMRMLINYQGSNAANPRGYFSWRHPSLGYLWSADRVACTGSGGFASKHPTAYNPQTVKLVGCNSTLSGNTRTVVLTVEPQPSFGSFGPSNDVSFWAQDFALRATGWTNWDLNFSSAAVRPALAVSYGTNPAMAYDAELAWGTVDVGSGSGNLVGKPIKVKNTAAAGAQNLVLVHSPSNVEVVNTVGNAFSWAGTLASPLAPGAEDNFTVRLDSSQAGDYAATVKIWHNDPTEPNPFRFRVSGTVRNAGPPQLAVSEGTLPPLANGATLAWGWVAPDSGTNHLLGKPIRVANAAPAGDHDLVLAHAPTNVEVVNIEGAAFSWAGTLLSPLAPGASDNFVVQLDTAVQGTYSALVKIWHDDPSQPNPFQLRVEGSVRDPSLGDPEITSLTQAQTLIYNSGKTTVTVHGSNLQGTVASIATLDPPEGASSRAFPAARVLSVNAAGTQMQVEVDATNAQVEEFHTLVVKAGEASDAEPFRVLPHRPVVDLWSPGKPEVGKMYLMAIVGYNLQGASVSATRGQIVSQFNSTGTKITGRYRAPATPGPAELVVTVGGEQLHLPITVVGAGQSALLSQDLTAALRTKASPSEAAVIPRIYLQVPSVPERPGSRMWQPERLMPLKAADFAPPTAGGPLASATPSAAERPEKLAFELYRYTWNLVDLHHREALMFDPGTGAEGDAILQALDLGVPVRVGGLVLSFYLRVDLSISFWFDVFAGFTYPIFCAEATLGAEIPGTPGYAIYVDYCTGGGAIASTNGTLAGTVFTGGPCAQVVNDPVTADGRGYATVTQKDCCEQPISLDATGATFSGFSFGQPFDEHNPLAGLTTPAPMCIGPCEVSIALPPGCVAQDQAQTFQANASPAGGQYLWYISEGADKASIDGAYDGAEVTIKGDAHSLVADDVTVHVAYTTSEGATCDAEAPFSVIQVNDGDAVPLTLSTFGVMDFENDKRLAYPSHGTPQLGSVTPATVPGALGFYKNMQMRSTVKPCDPNLRCGFDFKRNRSGPAITYLNGVTTPIPGGDCQPGPCPDDSHNNDEDLTIDPLNCSIYSEDTPGFDTGGLGAGYCANSGTFYYFCQNFNEWLNIDGSGPTKVRVGGVRQWAASTRLYCSNNVRVLDIVDNWISAGPRNCTFVPGPGPSPIMTPAPAQQDDVWAIVDGLRSSDDGERFAAYRSASPRERSFPLAEGDQQLLIEQLLLIAEEVETTYPMESSQLLAIRLLGEYRSTDAVPVLLDRIEEVYPRLVPSAEDAGPAAGLALLQIGKPAIGAILERVDSATDGEWQQMAWVLKRIEAGAAVEAAVRAKRAEAGTARAAERLRQLLLP